MSAWLMVTSPEIGAEARDPVVRRLGAWVRVSTKVVSGPIRYAVGGLW